MVQNKPKKTREQKIKRRDKITRFAMIATYIILLICMIFVLGFTIEEIYMVSLALLIFDASLYYRSNAFRKEEDNRYELDEW